MGPDEARKAYEELYGAVSDEEWAELSADVSDWDKFLADKAAADAPAPDAPAAPCADAPACGDVPASVTAALTKMQETIDDLAAKNAKQAEVIASLTMSEAEREKAAKKAVAAAEITASLYEVDGKQYRPAASAVEVLASLKADPSEETVDALLEHIKQNKGNVCLIPTEVAAAVTAGDAPKSADDEYLASLAEDEEALNAVKAIMDEENITARAAGKKYFKTLI